MCSTSEGDQRYQRGAEDRPQRIDLGCQQQQSGPIDGSSRAFAVTALKAEPLVSSKGPLDTSVVALQAGDVPADVLLEERLPGHKLKADRAARSQHTGRNRATLVTPSVTKNACSRPPASGTHTG